MQPELHFRGLNAVVQFLYSGCLKEMAFSASLVDGSNFRGCLAILQLSQGGGSHAVPPWSGLCHRYSIALLAANDMRYTESETDKRWNRKNEVLQSQAPRAVLLKMWLFVYMHVSKIEYSQWQKVLKYFFSTPRVIVPVDKSFTSFLKVTLYIIQ